MIAKLRKRTKFAIYVPMATTYILILFFMNIFIFNQFSKYFNIEKTITYFAILITLTIIFPIFIIIEKAKPRFFTRILYSFSMTGGGINFILFTIVLLNWITNIFFDIPTRISQLIIIIIPSAIAIYSTINATRLHTKKITVRIKGLKEKKKYVHLSDIHLGTIRNEEFLARIVRKTNNLKADAVFITGDLIDNNTKINKNILQELDNFRSPVFFSNGNHEQYEGYFEVNKKLSETKLKILKNKYMVFDGVQIIGVDYNFRHVQFLKNTLESLKYNRNKPSILLYHTPSGGKIAEKEGIDLMLSGHTHNGQIFPFNFIVKGIFKHVHGLYRIGKMRLYTSSGTGTWGPMLRLGSYNEIVLIEAIPKE